MNITVQVSEEEIKSQVTRLVKDILQKEITMRWIKEIVEDEVRKESKELIKAMREVKE